MVIMWLSSLFFFQAEDGIRDVAVTGVQTCALPICALVQPARGHRPHGAVHRADPGQLRAHACRCLSHRSEEHTSELQSRLHLVCRLLLEKKKATTTRDICDDHTHRRYTSYAHCLLH